MAALMNEYANYPHSRVVKHPMDDYVVDFVTGGVYMLLGRWMEEKMKTPAERMGQLAYQLTFHTVALTQ